MTENHIGQIEALHFKIKTFNNPACEGMMVGNTGLHFFNKKSDWTWHYQPDGNNGPVKEKEIEYSTIFLAAFVEFIHHWNSSHFSNENKPDLIQSLTNPTMATFLNEEFTEGIIRNNNYCNITFDLSAISVNKSLLRKFDLARNRCNHQSYTMNKK